MFADVSVDVIHGTIGNFDLRSCEDFHEWFSYLAFFEMLVYQAQELACNISFDTYTVGWVVIDRISLSFSLFLLFVVRIVLQVAWMPTVLQCFDINCFFFLKDFTIA